MKPTGLTSSEWNPIVVQAALERLHLPIQPLNAQLSDRVAHLLCLPGSQSLLMGATGFHTTAAFFARLLASASATNPCIPDVGLVFAHHVYEVVSDTFGSHPRVVHFLEAAIAVLDGTLTLNEVHADHLHLDNRIDQHIHDRLQRYGVQALMTSGNSITSGHVLWLNLSAIQLIRDNYASGSPLDNAILARFRARYSGVLTTIQTGYAHMPLESAVGVRHDSVLLSATLLTFCRELGMSDWKLRLWLENEKNIAVLNCAACLIARLVGLLNDMGTFLLETTPERASAVLTELLAVHPELRQALAPDGMRKSDDTGELLLARTKLGNADHVPHLLQLLKDAANNEANLFLDSSGDLFERLTWLQRQFVHTISDYESLITTLPAPFYAMLWEGFEFHRELYSDGDYYNQHSISERV